MLLKEITKHSKCKQAYALTRALPEKFSIYRPWETAIMSRVEGGKDQSAAARDPPSPAFSPQGGRLHPGAARLTLRLSSRRR